jgi:hypothetical protein
VRRDATLKMLSILVQVADFQRGDLGPPQAVHVDPEAYGRELGLLPGYEVVEQEE